MYIQKLLSRLKVCGSSIVFRVGVKTHSFYIFNKERTILTNENKINYQLSLHILKSLRDSNLISEEEFAAIDMDNQKSFQMQEYWALT